MSEEVSLHVFEVENYNIFKCREPFIDDGDDVIIIILINEFN